MMKSITNPLKGTKAHIAKVCLETYERILKEGKKDNLASFKRRLGRENSWVGVCNLYFHKTRVDIKLKPFIRRYGKTNRLGKDTNDAFWCKLPYYADSKKEAIDLIKKRMEILKNW